MTSTLRPAAGVIVAAVFWLSTATTPGAWEIRQTDWLPADVAEGLTQQLADRVETAAGKAAANRAEHIEGARVRVRNLRTVISGWSVTSIMGRAPKPERVSLPTTGNPHLDATVRYHLCNMVLMLHFEQGQTFQERQAGALGLTGLAVLQVRLLSPYLAGDGKTANVEAALTSAPLAAILSDIQRDTTLLAQVRTACAPVLADLLDMMR